MQLFLIGFFGLNVLRKGTRIADDCLHALGNTVILVPLCQCHTNIVNAAWKEHNPTGDWMPYVLAASQHGFQFIVQLSPHIDVGTFDGAMVKWIVLAEASIPSIVATLK